MERLTELTSLEMVETFIQDHSLSFLYVSRTNCGVCHALLPQVKEVLMQYPRIQFGFINADHLEEIAGYLSVFTVPALIFYIEGKEYFREARFVQIESLNEKIQKMYRLTNS
ncbi:thioredoxin family protein [Desertibacillus haloalkaliphilus]|uniref:thioredoxin family protein n=1 Tax=Desertibacillus haloalkaliphilus TaxID=1328930 RepID=UPI001C25719E|nr:thioredoxin family protein [Desertibacillus haloalkaliphilus]MBU8906217.1 thioredoxin family protein [Desertibacillus haloalkaliphilus]